MALNDLKKALEGMTPNWGSIKHIQDLFSVFEKDYDKQRKQLFDKCAYVDFEGKPAIVCNLCRFYHGLQKGCSWEEEKKELLEASDSLSPKEVKDVAIARKELASGKCKTFKTADDMIADLHEK